jgi:hypothetical protein
VESRALVDRGDDRLCADTRAARPACSGAAAPAVLHGHPAPAARAGRSSRGARRSCRSAGVRCVRMAAQRQDAQSERRVGRHRPHAPYPSFRHAAGVILAHELAHHVHHDIWKGIALETALLALGFYLTDRILELSAGRFGLTGKDDVAALPLLLIAAGVVSIGLLPLVNGLSRSHERRADRYALDMTGNAAAFISAMKRLGAQNLAEERPSRIVELIFYSHPPLAARVEAARAWRSTPR